jgi:uncharacterized protein (TIRG00374 family)
MKWLKAVAFLLGLCLLFWIVRKIGWQDLVNGFRTLGWRLFVPVVVIFPCYLIYTYSWRLFLKRFDTHFIGFWSLFRIKVAGEAANTLTPLNFAGGDPVRVLLLSKRFPSTVSGASVIVDRTLQILATVGLIFLGNVVALFKLELPHSVRVYLAVTVTFLSVFILLLVFHQTKGLSEKIFRIGHRLKIKAFSDERLKKMQEMDLHIVEFYRRDHWLFVFCFLLHFASRLIGVGEIIVIARFLGVPMGIWEGIFFAAVIPVVNLLSVAVPGNLGVLEGAMSSLFVALHWSAGAGVVLQIARRIRAAIWISIGVLFIFLARRKRPAKHAAKH